MGGGSTQCLPLEFYTSQVTSTKDDEVQRYASTMLVWHQNQRRLCFGVDIAHRGERVSLGLSVIAQFHRSQVHEKVRQILGLGRISVSCRVELVCYYDHATPHPCGNLFLIGSGGPYAAGLG